MECQRTVEPFNLPRSKQPPRDYIRYTTDKTEGVREILISPDGEMVVYGNGGYEDGYQKAEEVFNNFGAFCSGGPVGWGSKLCQGENGFEISPDIYELRQNPALFRECLAKALQFPPEILDSICADVDNIHRENLERQKASRRTRRGDREI